MLFSSSLHHYRWLSFVHSNMAIFKRTPFTARRRKKQQERANLCNWRIVISVRWTFRLGLCFNVLQHTHTQTFRVNIFRSCVYLYAWNLDAISWHHFVNRRSVLKMTSTLNIQMLLLREYFWDVSFPQVIDIPVKPCKPTTAAGWMVSPKWTVT